jgi:hypothetical protein
MKQQKRKLKESESQRASTSQFRMTAGKTIQIVRQKYYRLMTFEHIVSS